MTAMRKICIMKKAIETNEDKAAIDGNCSRQILFNDFYDYIFTPLYQECMIFKRYSFLPQQRQHQAHMGRSPAGRQRAPPPC